MKLGVDDLKDVQLIHISGRHAIQLTTKERAALKAYVESGGQVLVDAYAGSAEFAKSARAEIEAIFGKLQPLAQDNVLAEGLFDGGVDLSSSRFTLSARKQLRSHGKRPRGQKLLVAKHSTRPAVVFSEFDLSAGIANTRNFRSLGYRPESARQIVGNLLAYLAAD